AAELRDALAARAELVSAGAIRVLRATAGAEDAGGVAAVRAAALELERPARAVALTRGAERGDVRVALRGLTRRGPARIPPARAVHAVTAAAANGAVRRAAPARAARRADDRAARPLASGHVARLALSAAGAVATRAIHAVARRALRR